MTTEEDVLRIVRTVVNAGTYRPSNHFRQRMDDRGATALDVRKALLSATGAVRQPNGSWRVTGGRDASGDDLVVAVRVEDGLELVTLF